MKKYRLRLTIGYPGAVQEEEITNEDLGFTDEDWNTLTEENQQQEIELYLKDWSNNYIEMWFDEV